MNAPTERQLEILTFMRDHMIAEGMPPTTREIADRFGIASTNGVHDHLVALEKKGLVERSRTAVRARGWRPTRTVSSLAEVGLDHPGDDAPIATAAIKADDAISVGDFLRAYARVLPLHMRETVLRVGSQLSSAGNLAKELAR